MQKNQEQQQQINEQVNVTQTATAELKQAAIQYALKKTEKTDRNNAKPTARPLSPERNCPRNMTLNFLSSVRAVPKKAYNKPARQNYFLQEEDTFQQMIDETPVSTQQLPRSWSAATPSRASPEDRVNPLRSDNVQPEVQHKFQNSQTPEQTQSPEFTQSISLDHQDRIRENFNNYIEIDWIKIAIENFTNDCRCLRCNREIKLYLDGKSNGKQFILCKHCNKRFLVDEVLDVTHTA